MSRRVVPNISMFIYSRRIIRFKAGKCVRLSVIHYNIIYIKINDKQCWVACVKEKNIRLSESQQKTSIACEEEQGQSKLCRGSFSFANS